MLVKGAPTINFTDTVQFLYTPRSNILFKNMGDDIQVSHWSTNQNPKKLATTNIEFTSISPLETFVYRIECSHFWQIIHIFCSMCFILILPTVFFDRIIFVIADVHDYAARKLHLYYTLIVHSYNRDRPDSKVHGANMGPTWVLSAPDVGPWTLLSWRRLETRVRSHHLLPSILEYSCSMGLLPDT